MLEMVLWEKGDSFGLGVVIDSSTGNETDTWILPPYRKSWIPRLLRPNRLAWVNDEGMFLTVYSFEEPAWRQ